MAREGSLFNRSHGRRMSARKFTRMAIESQLENQLLDAYNFYLFKFSIADTLVAQYQLPIWQANHLIEQEGRRVGIR